MAAAEDITALIGALEREEMEEQAGAVAQATAEAEATAVAASPQAAAAAGATAAEGGSAKSGQPKGAKKKKPSDKAKAQRGAAVPAADGLATAPTQEHTPPRWWRRWRRRCLRR